MGYLAVGQMSYLSTLLYHLRSQKSFIYLPLINNWLLPIFFPQIVVKKNRKKKWCLNISQLFMRMYFVTLCKIPFHLKRTESLEATQPGPARHLFFMHSNEKLFGAWSFSNWRFITRITRKLTQRSNMGLMKHLFVLQIKNSAGWCGGF